MVDSSAEQRALARRSWPVRKYRLGDEPPDDLRSTTTASERLGMVWQLTRDAWAMAGREIPDYPRREMPIRVRRLGDAPVDVADDEPCS